MVHFKSNSLTPVTLKILRDKATEHPFTGEYNEFGDKGTYLCRQCGLALFRSNTKFHSGCGWPSFDEEVDDAVERVADKDGHRTEIVCRRCKGHLGHVFLQEGFTAKNTRHCVNSQSLDFVANQDVVDTEEAIVAGGCFWGMEYLFNALPGVLKAEVGYIGGQVDNPTYEQVCTGRTGHIEAVRVVYDPAKISYEAILKYFFEIHDPTQANGQGPDIGSQYISAIFCYDEKQHQVARKLIDSLAQAGYKVATKVLEVSPFWRAEPYHQQYYLKTGKQPYCHFYTKRF